jgi:hypothetical protein
MDADPAAAHAMANRLALDQIQRVAEGAQEFRKPNFLHTEKRSTPGLSIRL